MRITQEALTFDDVLLLPAHSQVLPNMVDLKTKITRDISQAWVSVRQRVLGFIFTGGRANISEDHINHVMVSPALVCLRLSML